MNQQPPGRLLRSFERYLRATNRSEWTVGNYLENLHQVEVFLQPRGMRLRDATRADLEEFLADLLKACEGKGFEARRDTALIMLLLDTGTRRDELMSRTLADLDQNLDVLLVLGKGRRERACPTGTRPRWRWTAICGSVSATRTRTCPGCGWGYGAGSPRGAWSACSSVAVGRLGWLACIPTSSAMPSLTSGLPRAVPRWT